MLRFFVLDLCLTYTEGGLWGSLVDTLHDHGCDRLSIFARMFLF